MPDTPAFGHENDDALLVAAVIRGDREAFRSLIHHYERLVVSIVFKMVVGREDCEDICQDIFLKVYEKLPTFRFESKLSTWIGTIAYNSCINFLRKKKQFTIDVMTNDDDGLMSTGVRHSTLTDDVNTPIEVLLSKERESVMIRSMARLPVIQKTILLLFHHENLSLQEIAVITSLPLNTVKSHLFRARKQLKEIIDQY